MANQMMKDEKSAGEAARQMQGAQEALAAAKASAVSRGRLRSHRKSRKKASAAVAGTKSAGGHFGRSERAAGVWIGPEKTSKARSRLQKAANEMAAGRRTWRLRRPDDDGLASGSLLGIRNSGYECHGALSPFGKDRAAPPTFSAKMTVPEYGGMIRQYLKNLADGGSEQ